MTNDMMQDLSFNPESDYSMVLFESLIDEAVCEVRRLRRKIHGDVDPSLESLTKMFQDDDFEDGYVSESLQIAYEGALSDLGTKIKSAWEDLKRKCKAFFSRVSESLKNMAARFQASLTSTRVKADIKLSSARVTALKNIPNVTNALSTVKIETLKDIKEKLESMMKTYEAGKNNKSEVEIKASDVKTHIKNLAVCLKAVSKALSEFDKLFGNLNKLSRLYNDTDYSDALKNKIDKKFNDFDSGSELDEDLPLLKNQINKVIDPSNVTKNFSDTRQILTGTMKFVRESIAAIASAIKSSSVTSSDKEKETNNNNNDDDEKKKIE